MGMVQYIRYEYHAHTRYGYFTFLGVPMLHVCSKNAFLELKQKTNFRDMANPKKVAWVIIKPDNMAVKNK